MSDGKRVAFVISGAAALIAQELALLEVLTTKRGVTPDVVAGTSSGSLSAVALNAVLEGRLGWDELKTKYLFPMRDSQVFSTGLFASLKLPWNLIQGFVLDTRPLKRTLERIVNGGIGYHKLGNTFVRTFISAVDRANGRTRRFDSHKEADADLDLVEVLLASSAIPVVFPERQVTGVGTFVDGGTGTDNVPVEALAQLPRFDEIYVVTHEQLLAGKGATQRQLEVFGERMRRRHRVSRSLISDLTFALDVQWAAMFFFQLFRATTLVENPDRAFLYMPRDIGDFGFLEFGSQERQFRAALSWAENNDPQPIPDFLRHNFPTEARMLALL